MAKKLPKIELTLLKKLVGELETALTATQELPLDEKDQVFHFITELSKATGLASGIAQEATALIKDMYQVSAMSQKPAMPAAGADYLAELFGDALSEDPDKKNRN